jgi:AbrB family looped-hinge helix DNA binding protein
MERVTLSSKGQIAIPKAVRDRLNLLEGTKLTLEVRGPDIVLSKEPAWRMLRGAGRNLMTTFVRFKKEECEREDSRP